MLDKRGAVLETAHSISRLLRQGKINGAVIGGIAVVLHGHVRTTRDVDVWVQGPLAEFGNLLEDHGATFDRKHKEFILDGIPVHLVAEEMAVPRPSGTVEIDGILTVSLADLINLKLHSGMKNIARAQDIADVIGLIRQRRLTAAFAGRLHKSLRAEFRKLVKAVRSS